MEKRQLSRVGFGFVLMIIFGQVSAIALKSMFSSVFPDGIGDLIAGYLGMYLIGLPILLVLTRDMVRSPITKGKAPSIKEFFKFFMVSVGGMLAINLLYLCISGLLTGKISNQLGDSMAKLDLPQSFLIVVLIGPIIEELIFRGLIYKLVAPFGEKSFLVYSSVIFGLFHMNIGQALYSIFLGYCLAVLLCRTRKIIYPILLHVLINFTSGFLPMVIENNNLALLGFAIWLLVAIISFIVIAAQIFRRWLKGKKNVSLIKGEVVYQGLFLNLGTISFIVLCVGMMVAMLVK